MNEKRPTPDQTAGNRKRTAPTIDLKANEIPPAAASAGDPPVKEPEAPKQDVPLQEPPTDEPPQQEPPKPDPVRDEPAIKEPPKEPAAQQALKEAALKEQAAKEQAAKEQAAKEQALKAQASTEPPKSAIGRQSVPRSPPRESFTPPPGATIEKPAPKPRSGFGAGLAGGIVGAAVMAGALAGAWSAGLLPLGDTTTLTTPTTAVADPRIAALEAQLKQLESRPLPTANAGSEQQTSALNARIASLEDQISKVQAAPAAPDSALNDKLAANDTAVKSLDGALAALNRRADELAAATKQAEARADAAEKAAAELRGTVQAVSKTASAGASSADLAPLQQRLAALEAQGKTVQADLAKATASDNAARLALSATALRDAALRGAPFAAEMAQAKTFGADEKTLAPLAPFAASGVPTDRALAKELSDLLPAMQKVAGAPAPAGGFLDRLQANAQQLVRVRPVGAPAGDDAATVLARLEVAAADANIAAALTDIAKLPEAARQPATDWVSRATAKQQALAAARQLAADSARSLGSK